MIVFWLVFCIEDFEDCEFKIIPVSLVRMYIRILCKYNIHFVYVLSLLVVTY